MTPITARLITIGDEILIGQITDTNATFIGQFLSNMGVTLAGNMTVGDQHQSIVQALELACSHADLVLTTGGLGPTKDDITKKALADFLDVPLVFHEEAYELLSQYFANLGKLPSERHRLQAYLPQGVQLLTNNKGTAPGMLFKKGGTTIISMPGVPYEMKDIMTHGVSTWISSQPNRPAIVHRTIRTVGIAESDIEEQLTPLVEQFPDTIKIAYLPSIYSVRLRLSGLANDHDMLATQINQYTEHIKEILGTKYIYGEGALELSQAVGHLLQDKGQMVAIAESCTGGYLSHLFTKYAGSSAYYKGGLVPYSNELKEALLYVPADLIEKHGAVSEPVVSALAQSVRKRANTAYSIATSGIAGPTGGTPEKPVGTIWVAISGPNKTATYQLHLRYDRMKNIIYTCQFGLNELRKMLLSD